MDFDISTYIAQHTMNFVGREWIFDEISQWLSDPSDPQFFIITGEPGVGKTCLAAKLTQKFKFDAVHFCIARQASSIDPVSFSCSIAYQLSKNDFFAKEFLEEQGIHINATQQIRQNHGHVINVKIEQLSTQITSGRVAFVNLVVTPLKKQ